MSDRLNHEEINSLLNKADSYDSKTKNDARAIIQSTIRKAYRAADEATHLREELMEQAREVTRLQIQLERWEERYNQQPQKFAEDSALCDPNWSDGTPKVSDPQG